MKGLQLFICSILTVSGVGFGAETVSAQVDPDIQLGSKIPVRPEKKDPVRDGIVRDQYARCAYGPYKEQLDNLLHGSDPLTADFEAAGIDTKKLFRRNKLRRCFVAEGEVVQASISFTPASFRYIMLEAAYRSAHNELPTDYANRVGPARRYVSTGDTLVVARSLGAFSDCLAAADPVGADRILRTPSGTEKEKDAAMAMVPALSSCIVEGQELKLTAATIRTFSADGMWQRYVASKTEAS